MTQVTIGTAQVTNGNGTTTLSTSVNLDASSSTDGLLVAGSHSNSDPAQAATGMTWDVPTPENFNAGVSIAAQSYMGADLWYMDEGDFTAASDTVTATWASAPDNMTVWVVLCENVDQTTPIGTTGTDNDAGNVEVSVALTGAGDDDIIIGALSTDGTNPGTEVSSLGAGQTEIISEWSNGNASVPCESDACYQDGGVAGDVLSYGSNGVAAAVHVLCAMEVNGATGGGGGATVPIFHNYYRQMQG